MPAEFPYMNSVKNVPAILSRIQEAGAPPKFTVEFLKSSLGFSSSNDRGILAILKKLGFLAEDGTPTDRYHEYRHGQQGRAALASGLRDGWSALFLADQKANERTATQLTELFKSVTGKSESVAKKMATTFKAFADAADWSKQPVVAATPSDSGKPQEPEQSPVHGEVSGFALHHDIHVHLPATSDVAVYRAIFRALREEMT